MDCSSYFFIVQNVITIPIDSSIKADAKFSNLTCSFIHVQNGFQKILFCFCTITNQFSIVEFQANSLYDFPCIYSRKLKIDVPVYASFHRRCKQFSIWHITMAVRNFIFTPGC